MSDYTPPPVRPLLCIERPEEMGRLNIELTSIRVVGLSEGPDGNPAATLIGGQNVCFRVHGSVGKIVVRFSDPDGVPGEAPYWTTSFPVALNARENDFELSVADQPRDHDWGNTGWHHMWRLDSVSTFCRLKPQWRDCPDPGGP
jgi:hypothetical protein